MILLIITPSLTSLAESKELSKLLAFVEANNSRLLAQRALLTALDTASNQANQEVLGVLKAEQKSWLKYGHLTSRLGARISPGDEGTGVDGRVGVQFAIPFADYSGRLALARERQAQQGQQRQQQQQQAAAQLAYAKLRDQIFSEVITKLALLEEAATNLAAVERQWAACQSRKALLQKRIDVGVESRAALWPLGEQIRDLERQIPVMQAKTRQVRTEIAFYGGKEWKTLWNLLDGKKSWIPSAER